MKGGVFVIQKFFRYIIGVLIISLIIFIPVKAKGIFVDTKTLYKGFCRTVETLNTYQIFKNEEITNNLTGKKTLIRLGFKSGYGSLSALANGAIVNYFN